MKVSAIKNRETDPLLLEMFSSRVRKGDLKKAEIIEAAISVLAETGFDDFSFESIGRQMKIRKSHVNYHFRSKDEILQRSIEYVTATAQREVVESLASSPPGAAYLKAYIRANFRWLANNPPQARVFLLFYGKASRENHFRELQKKIREGSQTRIAAVLAHPEFKSNAGKSTARIEEDAEMILDLLTGSMIASLTTEEKLSLKALEKKADRVIEAAFNLLKA